MKVFRSLARDNKHAKEKEQVIKLIRTIVVLGSERHDPHGAVGTGTVPLSDPVMRAFIAVAEHAEDPFRPICVQTLAEICKQRCCDMCCEDLNLKHCSADRY